MARDIELPLGKRKPLYRFFEILPGFLSYFLIILLVVLSLLSPILGSIYVLALIAVTLAKAIGIAVRTVQGFEVVKRAEKINWAGRLADLENPAENIEKAKKERGFDATQHVINLENLKKYPKPEEIYHAVIMVAYNEGLETMIPSVEAVRDTDFDNKKIIFVLGYEERGGEEMAQNAQKLKERFDGVFYDFILVKHPDGVKNEIKGKGPNLCCAAQELTRFIEKKKLNAENIIVTSLDSDNRMSVGYLSYVAYEFIVHENRQHLSYQPVSLFMNNIWEAAPPMRVIAVSNSFFNIINTMRPHLIRNFASHSQPFLALREMDFWSKRTIVEDGHQYWRSYFHFEGKYDVISIKVPIYQDAVIEDTIWKTLKAQFVQLRRWDYGASDVAYVGVRLFDKKYRKCFVDLLPKFVRLIEGHVTLAIMAPIVAFGGWVPRILNFSSRNLATYNLPATVSWTQFFASMGLFITILLSLRMLPKRPAKYRREKTIAMVLQWILMPIIAIVYQSMAAFYAQTRLMFGNYMEKFDVTRKVVKK